MSLLYGMLNKVLQLLGSAQAQWRNDAPGAPATRGGGGGGRRLRGAPNRLKNVGQFCKINCATSKSARLVQ